MPFQNCLGLKNRRLLSQNNNSRFFDVSKEFFSYEVLYRMNKFQSYTKDGREHQKCKLKKLVFLLNYLLLMGVVLQDQRPSSCPRNLCLFMIINVRIFR